MRTFPFVLLAAVLAAPLAPAAAETVILTADRDATLIEDPLGALANGAGPDLFAGRTSQPAGSIRRGLVRFDLAGIPRNAVVESVTLRLHVAGGNPGSSELTVHRVLASWGEGASFSGGGGGAPAQAGDATWIERFHDPLAPPAPPQPPASAVSARSAWSSPGGDIDPVPGASRVTAGPGPLAWDGPGLVADVQEWVRHPARNHGWAIVGDETMGGTARRLASRQNAVQSLQPSLEVRYRRR